MAVTLADPLLAEIAAIVSAAEQSISNPPMPGNERLIAALCEVARALLERDAQWAAALAERPKQ